VSVVELNVSVSDEERMEDNDEHTYDGVGQVWPEQLHVSFDNATGESKNQYVLRWLGLLVKHGIFKAITVGNLLVGHTHDIVDQMFSVWARALHIYDTQTYEKMRDLFRERYSTRIEGLVDLMRKKKEALEALDASARDAFAAEAEEEAEEWNSDIAAIFEEYAKALPAEYLNQHPHIELITASADIQHWLCSAFPATADALQKKEKRKRDHAAKNRKEFAPRDASHVVASGPGLICSRGSN